MAFLKKITTHSKHFDARLELQEWLVFDFQDHFGFCDSLAILDPCCTRQSHLVKLDLSPLPEGSISAKQLDAKVN